MGRGQLVLRDLLSPGSTAPRDRLGHTWVCGRPHPLTGEAVKAYVVVDGEHGVDEESLISWCTDHLARYKCPTKVLFVDELPRNATGKVQKNLLRVQHAALFGR